MVSIVNKAVVKNDNRLLHDLGGLCNDTKDKRFLRSPKSHPRVGFFAVGGHCGGGGLSPSFGAGLGMTAIFCGVTNCPVTSLILCLELFGGQGLPYFALLVAVTYMLSGYGGLYGEQKIVYSKLKAEFIDIKAR